MHEVFIDVDLMKALTKCYNTINKTFHKKDRSVFLSLDKKTYKGLQFKGTYVNAHRYGEIN